MIYAHSIERAVQYYPERPALYAGEGPVTFRELHQRVTRLAAELTRDGFRKGDRLAILLPNGPDYLELVYACSRLGVIVVPNTIASDAPALSTTVSWPPPRL